MTIRKTFSLPGAPVVRFSHSMAFIHYLRRLGAPIDRYLESSKLPRLCEQADTLVPVPRMYALLDMAAREEASALGWWVGKDVGSTHFSKPLRNRLEAVPSLATALECLPQLINSAEASDIDVGVCQRDEDVLVYSQFPRMRGFPGYTVAQAYQIGILIGLVRMFLGKNWLPEEIGLECRHTPRELPRQYHACKILTGRRFGYFTVPKSCLHRSMDGAPARNTAEGGLHLLENMDELELTRNVLRSYLPDGYISQAFAAEILGTSVRSLTRRLAEYGTTYRKLIDGVRIQVAKDHLGNPDMKVRDVANAVGFEDQGDFTRAFRRITGLTPTKFRKILT